MTTIEHVPYVGSLRWRVCVACEQPWPCSFLPDGGCEHCGVYRLDGRPPILHREGCPDFGAYPAWSLVPGALS